MSATTHPPSPRPYYWSVRRELWENRFVVIAPIAVAALVLFAFMIGTMHLPDLMMTPAQAAKSGMGTLPHGLPYGIAAIAIMLTGMLSGVFYCLGALYNERRDRSILFWKSLPVSDHIAVLAKASIPLLVLPIVIFIVTLGMQLVMLALGLILDALHGAVTPAFWSDWPYFRMGLVLAYGLITLTLWHAPIYGWLLLVSAWARRAPFLWAVLPPLALCIAEKIAFDSTYLGSMLVDRLAGAFDAAFIGLGQNSVTPIQLSQIAPMQFLATPQLWTGLALTILFLAAAIRLRRQRGPL